VTHKKQLYNLVENIIELNKTAWDNQAGSYDDKKESAMQIEEALEGLIDADYDVYNFTTDDYNDIFGGLSPRAISRDITNHIALNSDVPTIERVDKHIDSIYLNIGSLHKIGLSAADITDALQIVHDANKQKTGEKDETGKVIKPKDFIEPDEAITQLLIKRGISL